jgi:hypothetical protein
MATVPRSPASRAIADFAEEVAMARVNEENEARLKRAIETPLVTRPKVDPLIGDNPLPGWPAKRSQGEYLGSTSAPVIEPDEDDPIRGYTSLGRSPALTRADIEGEPQYGSGEDGIGGPPSLGLSEADITDLRAYKAERDAARLASETRSRLLDSPTTPEQAAQDIDLADKSGVNRIEVEQNRESFRAADQAREIDRVYESAPLLRDWARDRANFDVAHDDLDNLEWWERAGKLIGAGAQSAPAALGEGFAGTGQMIADFIDDYLRSPSSPALMSITGEKMTQAQRGAFIESGRLPQKPRDEADLLPQTSRALGQLALGAKRERERLTPTGMNDIEAGVYSGVQSLLVQSPGLVVSAITKTPLPAIGTATIATTGPSYVEAREQGLSVYEATEYAVTQGAIEYVTEKIPMSQLFGDIANKTGFLTTLRNNLIAEGASEQAATLLQDASTWASLNPEKTLAEFLAERPSAALQTAVATVVQSGAQTTLAQGVDTLARQFEQNAQQRRSEDLERTFEAMAQGAKDSKLLTRLPEKYREAVAAVTKDGPLESVRVSSEAINEFAQANDLTPEQLSQAFRIDPAEMVAAIQSGDDVVIPAGNYAAVLGTAKKEIGISGETLHAALAPNMRLRADDFTAKEHEAMKAVFEEEQKARETSATTEQTFADSADRVRETIREQVANTKLFNTETANTQAAIAGEMVVTLAERTGQDPEALWKEMGFDVVAALTGEEDADALPQQTRRTPAPIDDETLTRASSVLSENEFEAWKAASEGLTNDEIAVRMGGEEGKVTETAVSVYLGRAEKKGFPSEKLVGGRPQAPETEGVIRMLARGADVADIAQVMFPDRDPAKAKNQIRAMRSKYADRVEAARSKMAFAQGDMRGSFTPRADRSVIRLFESSNLSTFVHEASHWYLDTLWKMAQTETPHPFVQEQLAAILEWKGKSPNWTAMFDAQGRVTEEGRDVHEAFAETFEAYLREGKAPSTSLRSVFATLKQWLLRIYKSITQIGRRVRLNDEIRAVFDRMLATEEAIKAATQTSARDSEQMAKALLDKGVITEKAFERTKARLLAARERAEADLMARLMEDYERNQKAWWRSEERQVRAEVTSEVDERPEQRAYQWLSGGGWRSTQGDFIDAAAIEAEAVSALLQADGFLDNTKYFEPNATDESLAALRQRMMDDNVVPIILLFRTDAGRIIAFPGGNDGYHHDLARVVFALGDIKLEHGVYNPKKWPTLADMDKAGVHAWYATSGTEADIKAPASGEVSSGLLVYRGSGEDVLGEVEKGRLGNGLYSAEEPWIGAEWGGQTGKIDAWRINGKLFDLDEETSRGLENYEKPDDTPQAKALFARLKAEGYVGVRDPWSGHINVFVEGAMVRQPEADQELGSTWTNDEEMLAQTGSSGRTVPPPNLPPMRLDLNAVREQYGEDALAKLPPEVRAYSAAATDADQFLEIARDVRRTLNQKKPRSLWQFLARRRYIGSGNDKIAYSGIRDPGGEIKSMIGERKTAPGLLADETKDNKRVRSYSIHDAAVAAWEEGYFSGESPPDDNDFLDALGNDVGGQGPLYSRTDIDTVQKIRDAETWEQWFDGQGIDIAEKDGAVLRAKIETALTGQTENAIGPDEAAPFFDMPDGNALLQGLREGPRRNALIKQLTEQRMIARHGDPFKDGTIMQEAEKFARNEVQQRHFEIELEALAKAAGQQFAGNLAKQQAQENLRTKQVREVLNYNQWLILEQRWGRKAMEAAGKGKFDEAAQFKRYQLVNLHMFREGRKMAEDAEKTRKHLIAYGSKTKQQRLFSAGEDYASQMNGLLDDYMLRPESKRQEGRRASRAQWIQAQMAGIDPFAAYQDPTKTSEEQRVAAAEALERSQALAALAEGAEARNYKSLTVEELESVRAEADMIWRLATLKDRLIKEGERRRLSLAAEDIAAEVETNQPNQKPPEPLETDTAGEIVKGSVQKYFAMHRTLHSLAHQFAGGKDGGVFWRYIVKPLNAAFAHLSSLRKQMGEDVIGLFGAYTQAEQERFYRDRRRFNGIGRSLTTQGRLAIALNWGNAVNRKRLMDAYGWNEGQVQEVLDTLSKRDWDWVQSTWNYLDTWFPEANRVHESVHGAPMSKEQPLQIATRFGIYAGGYYPLKFDPKLSSKTGQRAIEADALPQTGNIGQRRREGYTRERVKGKVTLPLRLSALDVIVQHLDEVARSIATEEILFDIGRIIKRREVEDAIVGRHGRQIYNTIVSQLVTAKFGMEGTSGLLAHLRNGATVVGLAWKASTAALQVLGASNSVVRVGGPWVAKGYARMGKDAATLQSSADWIMERSEFMRHRRQTQSPEMASLLDAVKNKWTPSFIPRHLRMAHRWMVRNGFALMANTQFYGVDMPTWYGAYFKAQHYGAEEGDAIAMADQAVVDAQGGGELHQLAAMQSGAGTKYAALLRILTNFMSYMITTYNLGVQRVRNARTAGQIAALSLDLMILAAVPVAGKMTLDLLTRGIGDDDEPEEWAERYAREQVAFLFGPFVGVSQFAGSARGDDSYGYKGPAGLAIFSELNQMGSAVAEADFDQSFWKPANRAAGMVFHYPAGQVQASVLGAQALWNGETDNPAAIFFGPPPAN